MVDAVLSRLSLYYQRNHPVGPTHVPVQSGSFHHVPGSERLVIILPYWHSKQSRFSAYRERLHKKGISTLYYDLGPHMLQAHVDQVLYNFTLAADAMCDEIKSIQSTFNITKLDISAFSLGNSFVGLIVKKLQHIDTLRMVVPGDTLAACLWRSIATRQIRRGLEAQGVSEAELITAWAPLAPVSYLPFFKDGVRRIEVTLARADKFIPYNRGLAFVNELKNAGAQPEVHVWRTGHGTAMIRYLRTK